MKMFEVDRSAVEVGLTKLKRIWSDVPAEAILKCVKGSVKGDILILGSKNSEVTGVVSVPLFSKAAEEFDFLVNGDVLMEYVRAAGEALLKFQLEETYMDIKTSAFSWRIEIRNPAEFPDITYDEKATTEVDRVTFMKALKFCEGFMGQNLSEQQFYGMNFREDRIESVGGGRSISIFRLPIQLAFRASPRMISVLETVLGLSGVEKIRVGCTDKVIVSFGQDTMIFDKVSGSFVETAKLESVMSEAKPILRADRKTLLASLKQVGVFGVDAKLELEKDETKLSLRSSNGANKVGGKMPVEWLTPDPFSSELRWGDIADSLESMDNDIVELKVGTHALVGQFIVLEEQGKIHMFGPRAEEKKAPKAAAKKKK